MRARKFAQPISGQPGARSLTDVRVNQVLVRFGDDDVVTRAVIACGRGEGICWVGHRLARNACDRVAVLTRR
jgi:hypothetical protein